METFGCLLALLVATLTFTDCAVMNMHNGAVVYPGDLYLGGLFAMHGKYDEASGTCWDLTAGEPDGIIPLEAALYVLDEINRSRILNFRLGLIAYDTCESHSLALERALHFIPTHDKGLCPTTAPEMTDVPVVGVVSGLSSGVTVSLAQLLRLYHVPQVSYLSTTPLLSDKRRFDYFFRTVPSDVNQVRAMIEIMKLFKWDHASIVYLDDEYGTRALHELEDLAPQSGICIGAKLKLLMNPQNIHHEYILRKLNQAEAKTVILFADARSLEGFFSLVRRSNVKDFIWIGSDGWGGREDVLNAYQDVIEGALTVHLNTGELPGFADHYTRLEPSPLVCQRNPAFCALIQSCRGHWSGNSSDCRSRDRSGDLNKKFHTGNVRNAVYAFAYALKRMYQDTCNGSQDLCDPMRNMRGGALKQYLVNVTFEDLDGTQFSFTKDFDSRPRYTIFNAQSRGNVSVWREVGKYLQDLDGRPEIQLRRDLISYRGNVFPVSEPCIKECDRRANEVRSSRGDSCCWKCVRCELWQYPEKTQCRNCPVGFIVNPLHRSQWNLSDTAVNACLPVKVEHLDYSSAYAVPILIVAGVGSLATCVSGFILCFHAKTPIIKAAGREHMVLLFVGILSSYLINYIILHQPTTWSCLLSRLSGICYSISNSALLVKIARIYRIFNTKESRRTQKLRYISPQSQIVLTLALVFVELVIVALWCCFDFPTVLHLYPSHVEHQIICSDFEGFKLLTGFCYPFMLLFPMAFLAFRTRTCPAAFSEAKYTGYGIYMTFINVLTFILVYLGNNSIQIRVLTVSIGLTLNASVILVTSFLTKGYVAIFRPHKNSKERIMNKSFRVRAATAGRSVSNSCTCTCKVHTRTSSDRYSQRLHSSPEMLNDKPTLSEQSTTTGDVKNEAPSRGAQSL